MSARGKKPTPRKIDAPHAVAWECDFGLCRWASPTREGLGWGRPSPEAKVVRVRIIKNADYLRLTRKRKRT